MTKPSKTECTRGSGYPLSVFSMFCRISRTRHSSWLFKIPIQTVGIIAILCKVLFSQDGNIAMELVLVFDAKAVYALKVRNRFFLAEKLGVDILLLAAYNSSMMDKTEKTDTTNGQVYILHFKRPYWTNCRHYVGYTKIGVGQRIAKHRNGTGSLLVNYAYNKKDIDFELGLIIDCVDVPQARRLEIQLKREGHLSRHCEICRKEKA